MNPRITPFSIVAIIAALFTSAFLCAASAEVPMLDSLDQAMVDSALHLIKLTPEELGFDKLWQDDDTFRLDVVEKYLNNPYVFPKYVDQTVGVADSLHSKPRDLLEFIDAQLKVDIQKLPKRTPMPDLKYDLAHPFAAWIKALDTAEPSRKRFYSALDSLEVMDLIMAAPSLWSGDGDTTAGQIKGAWQVEAKAPVDTSRKVDQDRLLDIIKKLDVHSLIDAAMIVVPAAQITSKGTADSISVGKFSGKVDGVTGDVLYYEDNQWGRFVIGGSGDNTYDGDFAGIIDVGGNDVYRGRVASGMGELYQPYGLVIDLSGNDYYDAGSNMVSQGAGFLGIGVLIDRAGDDTYRGDAYAQGIGLFGVGFLVDHGGINDYRARYFAQGAAHCGVGYLFSDGGGNDRYLGTVWSQGFAGTFGYGLIYDNGGNDNYRCGGVYLHAPLLPHDNQSFSNGFGMGWRPRAGGGIGVQIDEGGGVDYYDAEVMSFGSSYWYSIGILYDDGGNDRYSLAHYGMGSGIHLSIGAFYDQAGDDQYRSRMGVVGGTPHDLSTGIFVDGGGNDSYGTCDGWGGSLTNSYGLFVDRSGDDTYLPRPGGTSMGNASWARGIGGAAVFIDEAGDDVYPFGEPGLDSSIWIQSGWGIGMDVEVRKIVTEREQQLVEQSVTAEDSAKSIEELFGTASGWEVGNAIAEVRRARKALLTKGPSAAAWAIEHKLDSQNSLERIPFEQVVKAFPDTSGPLLMEKLDPKNGRFIVSTAASLLGAIKWKPAVEKLCDLLNDSDAEKSKNAIIGALGDIGDTKATPAIVKLLSAEKERRRLAALGGLRVLKDSTTIKACVAMLADKMFTVRSSAFGAAVGFGAQAVPELINYIDNARNPGRELAVNALGKIGQSLKDSTTITDKATRFEIVRKVENLTNAEDRMIRAEAIAALFRNSSEQGRKNVAAKMEAEYDPVVIAAYKRVQREAAK